MQQDDKEKVKHIQIANAVLIPKIIELTDSGKTVTLPLKGFSMRPFLEDERDKALLTKPKEIRVGDPVLAEVSPKHYVLHRIVKIEGNKVTLLGDGNLTPEHCLLNDVKCAVIGFYRKGHKNLDRTDAKKWQVYSKLWMTLLPIRRWLLGFYRRIWIPIFGAI